ncbi:serine/threonine protein kinase [Myxococcota bacterium]|nr:serine/threonine protein kinase [Myxococcota bacterium]MBU1430247.1 serine/threonine protein kinase [Myxococcota bacterium]
MSAALHNGALLAGRYRIHGQLGEGGMGAVYLARHEQLNRDVALKVLLPRLAKQREARARFQREAQVSSKLRHPHAVEIYDFGEDQGHLYIAMARLKGQTLQQILKAYGGALPLMRVFSLGAQLADVLTAAHRLPLIHRDIKPENIFIERGADGGDHVVMVDFGLAFIAGADELDRMTRAGEVFGSPPYMAPEQAQGLEVSPASDVYSLGCLLYELSCGAPPFEGAALRVITQHVFSAPTPPSERAPGLGIPKVFEQLILRMIRKAPESRPGAADVLRALKELSEGGQVNREVQQALAGRAARMVAVPTQPQITQVLPKAPAQAQTPDTALGVIGDINDDLHRQLRMNHVVVEAGDAPALILTLGAPDEVISALISAGKVVIAAADADMEQIAALLRLGVAEVVSTPLSVEDLMRKIRRAQRKARRQRDEA